MRLGNALLVIVAACLALVAALALASFTYAAAPGYYNPFEAESHFNFTRCFTCHYLNKTPTGNVSSILMGKGVVTIRHPHYNCTQCHGVYSSGSKYALAYGDTGPHLGGHPVLNCTCCHDPARAARYVLAATGVTLTPVSVRPESGYSKGDMYLVFAIGFAVGAFSSCMVYELVGRRRRY